MSYATVNPIPLIKEAQARAYRRHAARTAVLCIGQIKRANEGEKGHIANAPKDMASIGDSVGGSAIWDKVKGLLAQGATSGALPGAAIGAGAGGIYGAATGEGTKNRLFRGLMGALGGGAVGAAGGASIGALSNWVKNKGVDRAEGDMSHLPFNHPDRVQAHEDANPPFAPDGGAKRTETPMSLEDERALLQQEIETIFVMPSGMERARRREEWQRKDIELRRAESKDR